MRKGVLLRLHFKRAIKIYPVILLVTFLTVLSIAIAVFFTIKSHNSGEDKQKINIAIVGDTESDYINIGIHVLQNIDNSRVFVNFIQMEENEAVEALKNELIAGYVYIPEDFAEGVYHGRNSKAQYVIKDGPVNLSPMVSAEVINVISQLVIETQNGNYSLSELSEMIEYDGKIRKDLEKMTMKYFEFILERNNTYELNIIGVSDLLSFPAYYICSLMIFFMLIWGISCNRFFTEKNLAFARILKFAGIKTGYQIMCEFLTFFCVTLFTLQIFAVIFGVMISGNSFGIIELEAKTITDCIGFIFKMTPVILMFTAMHMALYEVLGSNVSGILVQFMIAVGLGYISGCFYPCYFFPEVVQKTADILPSGAGFLYVRKLMSETLSSKEVVLPVLYTFIFFALTVFMRKRNMEVEKYEKI